MEEGGRARYRLSGAQRRSREREPWSHRDGNWIFGDLRGAERRGAWPWARTTPRGDFQRRTL